MPIEELLAAVPVPPGRIDVEGDWAAAEAAVGLTYPKDFKQLIGIYGSGRFFFGGHLVVYNPLTTEGLAGIRVEREIREVMRGDPDLGCCPLPLFPEEGGLMPWGSDENGDDYLWLTEGEPDDWPVVVLFHGYASQPQLFRTDITGFLAGYATDRFDELAQPDDPVTEAVRVFIPGRTQAEVSRRLLEDGQP